MISEEKKKVLEFYNNGLKLYKARSFEQAKQQFEEALKIDPNDGPSKVYVGRCEEFIKNPPPADWDGVYTMTTK